MPKKVNTSATLKQNTKPAEELQAELDRAIAESHAKDDLVELFIPESYRGAFGNPAEFSVNGVNIDVPLGEPMMVPRMHYLHAQRLMKGAVVTKNQRRLTPEEVYKN